MPSLDSVKSVSYSICAVLALVYHTGFGRKPVMSVQEVSVYDAQSGKPKTVYCFYTPSRYFVVDGSPFVFCLRRKHWKSAPAKLLLEKIGEHTEVTGMKEYNGYTGKLFFLYMWK